MRTARWSTWCIAVVAAGSLTACNPATQATKVVQVIDNGNTAGCVQERSTIEKAVEAFTLLNPDAPVTEAALVSSGILHQESKLMDIADDGKVVPAPGTVCT